MSLPTIIFVPGAWHSARTFDKVKTVLQSKGYRCVALTLPSVLQSPPVTSLDEDIATIRSAVMEELDAGRDVMVNAHSWGAIPTCSALDGLSKQERGGQSGVVKLAFVASFVLSEGVSLEDAVGGRPDWWIVKDGTIWTDRLLPMLYHDADPKEAEECVANLKPHAIATFEAKARSAAWRRIPSAYLVCEDDQTVPFQGQDAMIANVKAEGGNIEVERLFVSHSPYTVKPEAVVDFLVRAAGGKAVV